MRDQQFSSERDMMKYSNSSMKKVFSLLLLALMLFFVAGQVSAEEQYDEETYGPADPIVWEKPVKAVVFEHKRHTLEAGLECDSCHDSGLFEMEAGNAEQKDDFTMKSLYAGKYCGACHDGDMAFASNTRCTSCHVGVKGYNRLKGVPAGAESEGHE